MSQAAGVPNAVNLPAQAGLGYFRKSLDEIVRFQAEFLWRDYRRGISYDDDGPAMLTHTVDYIRPQLFTTGFTPIEVSVTGPDDFDALTNGDSHSGNGEVIGGNGAVASDDEDEEEEEEEAIRTPKVGTVIIDQLRRIDFQPYRLWQPPLDRPVSIEDLVNRFLQRPWRRRSTARP